jgi:hypothetical protein
LRSREPYSLAGVLLRHGPILVAIGIAGACEVGSVNVLDPINGPSGELDGGVLDVEVVDATSNRDATTDALAEEDTGADAGIPLGADGGPCDLTFNGEPCTASSACCSGLCAADPTSKVTCRPANGCLGVGRECNFAGACCSLGCTGQETDHFCGAAPLCASAGGSCASASDCCADQCDGGQCVTSSASCSPAGESCKGNGECCGRVCSNASDGQQRCALLQACRTLGEICGTGADCCSATCSLDSASVGHCVALPTCMTNDKMGCTAQVGDVCMKNDDCCSRQCLAATDGAMRCAPAGGCHMECELCAGDGDCCSGSCVSIGGSVSICQGSGACGQDGEGCGANPQCCAAGPGIGCIENPPAGGFHRCHAEPAPAPGGGAPAGTRCALSDECASGFCLLQDGLFACAAACVPDGSRCTARADCCDPFADCMVERGALVCAPLIH